MEDGTKQLETLMAAPVVVWAGGENVLVRRLRTSQLVEAFRLVSALLSALSEAGKIQPGAGVREALDLEVADLFSAAYGPVADFSSLCTGKGRQWFDDLDGDEGLAVATAVLEVNLDFFAERLVPQLVRLGPVAAKMTVALGSLKSSQPSSGPATGGPTSSDTASGR